MTTTLGSIGQKTTSAAGRNPREARGFQRMAAWTIRVTGGRWGFLCALFVVVVWAVTGPYFRYSEIWQLVINTGTSIVTFLMVFLIQNAQNRESRAVHLKLDELIYSVKPANNELINIETLTEEQLEQLACRYRLVAERHRGLMERAQNAREHKEVRAVEHETIVSSST
jgi:low affinity Fe/Cu permease